MFNINQNNTKNIDNKGKDYFFYQEFAFRILENQNPKDIIEKGEIWIYIDIQSKKNIPNDVLKTNASRIWGIYYNRNDDILPIELKEKSKIIILECLRSSTMLYYKIFTGEFYSFEEIEAKTKTENGRLIKCLKFKSEEQKKKALESGLLNHISNYVIALNNTTEKHIIHRFFFLIKGKKKKSKKENIFYLMCPYLGGLANKILKTYQKVDSSWVCNKFLENPQNKDFKKPKKFYFKDGSILLGPKYKKDPRYYVYYGFDKNQKLIKKFIIETKKKIKIKNFIYKDKKLINSSVIIKIGCPTLTYFSKLLKKEKKQLIQGSAILTRVLKQKQNSPFSLYKQLLVLTFALNGFFDFLNLNLFDYSNNFLSTQLLTFVGFNTVNNDNAFISEYLNMVFSALFGGMFLGTVFKKSSNIFFPRDLKSCTLL